MAGGTLQKRRLEIFAAFTNNFMGNNKSKMKENSSKAVILLSGGQDSTTCLAWAKKKFDKIFAITFDYGQRHKTELLSAKKIAKLSGTPLKIIKIDVFKHLTKNALTDKFVKIKIQ